MGKRLSPSSRRLLNKLFEMPMLDAIYHIQGCNKRQVTSILTSVSEMSDTNCNWAAYVYKDVIIQQCRNRLARLHWLAQQKRKAPQ